MRKGVLLWKRESFRSSVHILLRSFMGVKNRGNVNKNQWIWEVPRYIHFHGILDDSMRVYQEDSQGNPVLSFMLVDKLLDIVLRAGLKPYIEFTFPASWPPP
jgi:hypothetical protein